MIECRLVVWEPANVFWLINDCLKQIFERQNLNLQTTLILILQVVPHGIWLKILTWLCFNCCMYSGRLGYFYLNATVAINTFHFKEIRLTFSSKYSQKWCNVKYLNGSYISGNVSHPFKLSDEKEINILEDSNIWLCIFQNVNIQRRQNWLCLCVFNNFADVGSSQ